jgi:hypothetical protein
MFVLEDYARALTHQKVVSVTLDSGTWAGGLRGASIFS